MRMVYKSTNLSSPDGLVVRIRRSSWGTLGRVEGGEEGKEGGRRGEKKRRRKGREKEERREREGKWDYLPLHPPDVQHF